MIQKVFQFLVVVLIALGFFLSSYLLSRYVQLASPDAQAGSDICAAVFGASCDETLASSYTLQLGLPLPGWGLVYYALLSSLLLIAGFVRPLLRFASSALFVLVSISGAVFSLLLAGLMLSGRAANCPACYGIHAVNLLLVPVGYLQTGCSMREIAGAWKSGIRYIAGGTMREPDLASARVLGLLAPFLVGLVVYQGVLIQLQTRLGTGGGAVRADQVLVSYGATSMESIPSDPADAARGPEDAPAELVVFSDFQCPACADFAHEIEPLRRQFESELRIVFKHYPLDSKCNPTITEAFHEQACWSARLAQAAHELGNFWPAHDALFGMLISENHEAVVEAVASATGLDANSLKQGMESPAIEAKVANDIQAGIDLGIPGTPTVFLNGRRLHDTRPEALRLLILHLAHSEESVASAP